MAHSRPPLSKGPTGWGELFWESQASERGAVRFVTNVRPGFWERRDASTLRSRVEQCDEARRWASGLADRGVGPGDHVLLLLGDGRAFFSAFFACQLLGAVPVPLVPPWSRQRLEQHVARIRTVLALTTPRVSILDDRARSAVSALLSAAEERSFGRLVGPTELSTGSPIAAPVRVDPASPALVQFTSGSTSQPRGVVLSHNALIENCHAIGERLGFDEPDHVGCSWLPLFHDMGLIGHVLVPLLWQIPTVLLAPTSFVERPVSWLEAIAHFGATISTAPNFAYQIAASRIAEEATMALDLSRWRIAMCGAEPIAASTLRAFAARYGGNGLSARALCPVYGLAEATLAVTLSPPGVGAHSELLDREAFALRGEARVVNHGSEDRATAVAGNDVRNVATAGSPESPPLEVVDCGAPAPGVTVSIRSERGEKLAEGLEGDIWVESPARLDGYLRDPASTSEVLVDGALRTGDRGYLRGGHLFVTGRRKEMIIKAGANYYPREIEDAAARVTGVRPGRVVAFGVSDEGEGTERLIVACELAEGARDAPAIVERKVIGEVQLAVGVRPDEVLLLEAGTLSKTSSGKLQRLEAQRLYLESALERPREAVWLGARLLLARVRLKLGLT